MAAPPDAPTSRLPLSRLEGLSREKREAARLIQGLQCLSVEAMGDLMLFAHLNEQFKTRKDALDPFEEHERGSVALRATQLTQASRALQSALLVLQGMYLPSLDALIADAEECERLPPDPALDPPDEPSADPALDPFWAIESKGDPPFKRVCV